PYYHPGADAPEIKYLTERRHKLGGYVPERREAASRDGSAAGDEGKGSGKDAGSIIHLPEAKSYEAAWRGSGKQQAATTMAFVRLLKDLMRDKEFGKRVVPIVPDESRTFGMDAFFPTAKIYNPKGQDYLSVDRELVLAYKESVQGQILHAGINEAGSVAAFTAAGTSYATHGEPLIPIYVFYSMFGFQRTGDSFWAAADQLTRGFIIGATAGRTTLTGEGLQHADGHSPVLASTNPAVVSHDPAYGYELGLIMKDGLERMYGPDSEDRNLMYYLTVYNEPIVQPKLPENLDEQGVLGGIYKLAPAPDEVQGPKAQLLASGVAVPWALEAQQLLADHWGVSADVWSVTSWTELRRDGLAAEEEAFLDPQARSRTPFVTRQMAGADGPIVAATDFMKAVPDQIRQFLPNEFATLGADGFGFADTRAAARRYFKIDSHSMVVRALEMLAKQGEVDAGTPAAAMDKYQLLDVNAGTSGAVGGAE
ncbi:transketolase-like TK C-terminal-containing protein, partial [Arthrobacter castelli]|uniref:transketolase-like TK C-terminal-containing protein n=1 Tax=Arthrobacter castelli TaxID=271431 RepID=UPI00047D357E